MIAANSARPLPSEQPAKAPKAATPIRPLRATKSGTLLVADDDPAIRGFVAGVLKDEGYQVLVAENGRHALEQCASYPGIISALITDAVMPEMNGRELAERALQVRPNLKVVMMSGYVDRGLKDENPGNPSYAFLEKPFSSEVLLDVVDDLCAAAIRASF